MTVLELRDELNELMKDNKDAASARLYGVDRDTVDDLGSFSEAMLNAPAVVGMVELFDTPKDWGDGDNDTDQVAVLRLE